MTVHTLYNNVSTSIEGFLYYRSSNWSTLINATTGFYKWDWTATHTDNMKVGGWLSYEDYDASYAGGDVTTYIYYTLWRGFLYFDTSLIDFAGETLTSAYIELNRGVTTANAPVTIYMYQGTGNLVGGLNKYSWNDFTGDPLGQLDFYTTNYNSRYTGKIYFNAAGLAYLNSVVNSTYLQIVLRHSLEVESPTTWTGPDCLTNFINSNTSNTESYRPKLVMNTTTTPEPYVFKPKVTWID